jgi:hypothetical protein
MKTIGEKLDDLLNRQTREHNDTYPYEDDGFPDRVAELIKEEYEHGRKKGN